MKVIFLGTNVLKLKSVFEEKDVMRYIGLNENTIYTKEDIISNKELFEEVKYIFSTWNMPTFSCEEIREYFPSLEAIFYAAGTVKYFAKPFIECGIRVFSATKANGIPVAEFCTSQIILSNKGYYQAQKLYKKPFYRFSFKSARKMVELRPGNYEAIIGIIGFGTIGRKVAELLKPYHLKIVSYDPYVENIEMEKYGVKKVELNELFCCSDVISNHLPNIPATKGILNKKLFSIMKKNVTFINTGRGAQVVEKDLYHALRKHPERCALLDVTCHEPIWPWSRLLHLKNVFITPHIAGSFCQEEHRMGLLMLQEYDAFIHNNPLTCEATSQMIDSMT